MPESKHNNCDRFHLLNYNASNIAIFINDLTARGVIAKAVLIKRDSSKSIHRRMLTDVYQKMVSGPIDRVVLKETVHLPQHVILSEIGVL